MVEYRATERGPGFDTYFKFSIVLVETKEAMWLDPYMTVKLLIGLLSYNQIKILIAGFSSSITEKI